MSNNPLVSILINCFNSQSFIGDCIKSAVNQSYKNIEIIVWDNSSTDNTSNIVNSFTDKRIKYFKNEKHLSLGEARIEAISHLNGDYIAILDSDDIAYKDRILLQIKEFTKDSNIGLLAGWMDIIDINSKVLKTYAPKFNKYSIHDQLYWTNPLIHSSIMYKKSVALNLKWYSPKITNFQDYQLSIKISLNYKIQNINKVIGAQRIHNSNSIKNFNTYSKQLRDYELLLRYIRFFIPKNNTQFKIMNTNSLKVNKLKMLMYNFRINKNYRNFFNIFIYIFKNPIILIHNGYIRKFFFN